VTVYHYTTAHPVGWHFNWHPTHHIDQPIVDAQFTILFVPVNVTFGVKGSAGFQAHGSIRPVHASAYVRPHVGITLYGRGGVGVDPASAGLGGELTLINASLTLGATVSLEVPSSGSPYFHVSAWARDNINTLGGRLYLYLRHPVPNFPDIWNTHITEHDVDIWSWEGLHFGG